MSKKNTYLSSIFLLITTLMVFVHSSNAQGWVDESTVIDKLIGVENDKDPFQHNLLTEDRALSKYIEVKPPTELANKPVLKLQLIEVKYAKAEQIVQLINQLRGQNMLSKQGSVSFDERTNMVIIKDSPQYLKEINQIIRSIDIPVKQVQIEARIVIVNEGSLDELGVRWGVNSDKVSGSIEGIYGNQLSEDSTQDIGDYLNVNLGSSSANASSIAFQVARLGSSALLDLELSALQSESKAEVISSPRLLTMNKKPAYIEQGMEIPYLESSENGVATVKFRKAVLSLEVTPQITPDNQLILELLVTQDRPGQIVNTGTGEAIAIDTQRINTQVIVDDGETVVLGGIFQRSIISSVDKVPLLADIPLLGNLFKRSYENEMKRELLIFVTPKVIFDVAITN